jgi:hypothetical protein
MKKLFLVPIIIASLLSSCVRNVETELTDDQKEAICQMVQQYGFI